MPAPTTVSLSGPSTGPVGVSSGTITITLDNPAVVTINVTLSVSTLTGTFSPLSPILITSGNSTATFTFMPSIAGSGTITATGSGGLTPGTLGYTATATTYMRFSDLTVATAIAPADLTCIVQNSSNTSLSATYELLQFLIQIPLSYANVSYTVLSTDMISGFQVDGSTSSVTITLPLIATWPAQEFLFINAGPSGTVTIAPNAIDVIIDSTGTPQTSVGITIGQHLRLRKVTMPSPGITGWYEG